MRSKCLNELGFHRRGPWAACFGASCASSRPQVRRFEGITSPADNVKGDAPTIWLRGIGPEYIEIAFRWAHEADPDALLFYNDYGGEGLGCKSDAIYALVRDLLQRDVPIHGVGLQMHVSLDWSSKSQDVAANMERLSALGLKVHITEMDVKIECDNFVEQ